MHKTNSLTILVFITLFFISLQSEFTNCGFSELTEAGNIVRTVSMTPKADILVTGAWDYKVRVYRSNGTNMLINQTLSQSQSYLYKVKVSDNGSYIYTASADRTLRIYNLTSFEDRDDQYRLSQSIGQFTIIKSVDATLDGNIVVTVNDVGYASVYHYNGSDYIFNQSFRDSPFDYFMSDVSITADGKYIVTGGRDFIVRVYISSRQGYTLYQSLPGATEYLNAVQITNDYRFIVAGGYDKHVRIYIHNGTYWNLNQTINYQILVYDLSITNDGRYLLIGAEWDKVKLFKRQNQQFVLAQNLTDAIYGTTAVQIVDSAQFVVTGSLDYKTRVYYSCDVNACSNCSWKNVCASCLQHYTISSSHTCEGDQTEDSYWYAYVLGVVGVIGISLGAMFLIKKYKLLKFLRNQHSPLLNE